MWRVAIAAATGADVPREAKEQLRGAVRAVFESWNSRRARRYRQHHGIPDDLGTAVTIQAMVFGNLDSRSGTGVMFSRNPLTGEPTPYGEYLPRAQGEDVVSGKFTPEPLSALANELPEAHAGASCGGGGARKRGRATCKISSSRSSAAGFIFCNRALPNSLRTPRSASQSTSYVKALIDEDAALKRITPDQVRILLAPHISRSALHGAVTLASGEGASPGVGIGVVVCDSDEVGAARTCGRGGHPREANDQSRGFARHDRLARRRHRTGRQHSHAAVIGRALGLPCVVGCGKGCLGGLRRKDRHSRWQGRQGVRRRAGGRGA